MSNYLNNIVARSLNAVEVMQPRLPLLLEPVASHIPSAPMPSLSEDESPDEYRPSQKPSSESPEALSSFTVGPIAAVVSETPVNRIVRATHLRSREPGQTDDLNSIQPQAEAAARKQQPIDPNEELDVETPRRLNDLATEKRSQERFRLSKHPHEQGTPARAGISATTRPSQHHGQVNAGLELAEPLMPRRRMSFESNGFSSLSPASSDLRLEQSEPPTIKITIGRVDVRALMPAPKQPTPPPVRPKPGLSLEDYLKQREEGKR